MNCPLCGGKSGVLDTRHNYKEPVYIRRRRKCFECKKRFSTVELITNVRQGYSNAKASRNVIRQQADRALATLWRRLARQLEKGTLE
jgi:transcriptional regulator NrdR family protein